MISFRSLRIVPKIQSTAGAISSVRQLAPLFSSSLRISAPAPSIRIPDGSRGLKTRPPIRVRLLKNVTKYGRAGEVITVRAGFMRNRLFPQGKADYVVRNKLAESHMRRLKRLRKSAARREKLRAHKKALKEGTETAAEAAAAAAASTATGGKGGANAAVNVNELYPMFSPTLAGLVYKYRVVARQIAEQSIAQNAIKKAARAATAKETASKAAKPTKTTAASVATRDHLDRVRRIAQLTFHRAVANANESTIFGSVSGSDIIQQLATQARLSEQVTAELKVLFAEDASRIKKLGKHVVTVEVGNAGSCSLTVIVSPPDVASAGASSTTTASPSASA